ncbi:HEAT repeat domain-containing protein [Ferrimonas balearica]|uniref:HEAT repeat domain-containing protein n=1 Tax=Ferrimonas balearica TaxID=44012 RepID=UPI001C98FFDE|nr:HEAT repeat domain-containing protein [Ferrimonas balearica]MBY5921733.1 HEAT repeat domain-containing protein [Ferrimonas balearica]MBY5994927.1 HEAT repeat domain-containing protein [Ferrimonas balearica]
MIESAEEFKRLRESNVVEEYTRAAHEEAPVEVWEAVLEKYPELSFWVAQNKTAPVEILQELALHDDSNVRGMVARKRKIPELLMLSLAKDKSESVRHALANNGKVTEKVLRVLIKDSCEFVRESASEKLEALTRNEIGC